MKRSRFYVILSLLTAVLTFSSCSKKEEASAGNPTYNAIVAQLEPGHEFLMVTGFEGEIAKGVAQLTPLIQAVVRAAAEEEVLPVPAEKLPLDIREAVRATGVDAVAGVGYSSRKLANEMFHNRTFVYMPQGRSGLFLISGENHKFTLAQRAPANTWVMVEADYDLTHIVSVVEKMMIALAGKELVDPIRTILLGQHIDNNPEMPTWEMLFADAKFSIELVLAADKDLVMGEYQGVSIPALDAYLQLTGPVNLFKPQLEELAEMSEEMGQVVKRDGDTLRIEVQDAMPWGEGDLDVRPVIEVDYVQQSIRVYSNRAFEETMKASSNRLHSNLDFQQATRDLPTAGTGRFYISKNLVTLGKNLVGATLQTAIEEDTNDSSIAVLKELKKLNSLWLDWNSGIAGVSSSLKNGLLYQENHFFSHRTKLLGALAWDSVCSSLLGQLTQFTPMFSNVSEQATNTAIQHNLRGLGVMVQMHHAAHNQSIRLKELKQLYDFEITPVADEVYPDFLFPANESWEYVVEYQGTYYVLDNTGKVTIKYDLERE
jgi:hypothetical protein